MPRQVTRSFNIVEIVEPATDALATVATVEHLCHVTVVTCHFVVVEQRLERVFIRHGVPLVFSGQHLLGGLRTPDGLGQHGVL